MDVKRMSLITRSLRKPFVAITFALGVTSCGLWPRNRDTAQERQIRIARLEESIVALDRARVSRSEASDAARAAVDSVEKLSESYDLVAPCWWHNCLVNMGFRKRGLCWQHAQDLGENLAIRPYRTFFFTRGIRAQGQMFHEHHCLVLLVPGMTFDEGLVLDSWEGNGYLDFYLMSDKPSRSKPWKENPWAVQYDRECLLEKGLVSQSMMTTHEAISRFGKRSGKVSRKAEGGLRARLAEGKPASATMLLPR